MNRLNPDGPLYANWCRFRARTLFQHAAHCLPTARHNRLYARWAWYRNRFGIGIRL